MRGSVLATEDSRFLALRPGFAAICDGNPCAALLLAHFDYWTAVRLEDRAHRAHHGDEDHSEELWLRATLPWLEQRLFGAFGRAAVRSALDLLDERGFLRRRKDPARRTRSTYYLFEVQAIAKALADRSFASLPAHDAISNHGGEVDGAISNGDGAIPALLAGASDGVRERSKENTPIARTPAQRKAEKRERIYEHYCRRIKPHQMGKPIPPDEAKIIDGALLVADVDECLAAIDGLSQSPHHNGVNDSNKKYLGLRYCLRGFKGGDTTRERIEKAMDWRQLGDGPEVFDDIRVKRLRDAVDYSLQTGGEIERGTAAKAKLVEMGFTVSKDPSGERAILRKVNTAA